MTEDTSRTRGPATLGDVKRAIETVTVGSNTLWAAAATRDPDASAEVAADLTDAADNLAEAISLGCPCRPERDG